MEKRYIEWVHDYFKIDPQLKLGLVFNTTDTNTTHTFNLTLGTGLTQKMQLNNIDPDTAVFMVAEKYSGRSYKKPISGIRRILDFKYVTPNKVGIEYFIDIIQLFTEMGIEYEEFDTKQLQRNLRGKKLNCLTDPFIYIENCKAEPCDRIVLLPNKIKIAGKDLIGCNDFRGYYFRCYYFRYYNFLLEIDSRNLGLSESIDFFDETFRNYDLYLLFSDRRIDYVYRCSITITYDNIIDGAFETKKYKLKIKDSPKLIIILIKCDGKIMVKLNYGRDITNSTSILMFALLYNLLQCNTLEEIEKVCEGVQNLYNKMIVMLAI